MWTGDIYLPTPHAARYFGNATQYGDLFRFVRRHGELLDATTEAVALPRRSEGRYTLTHSKGPQGGDGKRFRFPFPYTAKDYKGAHFDEIEATTCLNCDRGQHRNCMRGIHCEEKRASPRGVNKREQGACRGREPARARISCTLICWLVRSARRSGGRPRG